MEIVSKKRINGGVANTIIVSSVITSKYCFQAISSALCNPATASVARITPYFDSFGCHIAESR
jgi:hypothetical protein